ncbi:hypothetical protein AQUCO_12400003v1 [Aquilegia coerulea]|uniref:Uncharacterized protein n=1 Tax=Aquilegia coerulea TaxID=218851 RepID=A0A2G5C1I9_AQUCA|nr:hypothetical protein AQUCO_12400003v1 [Aquilegia coerulea]
MCSKCQHDVASSRLLEFKSLHEQRIAILNKLSGLQVRPRIYLYFSNVHEIEVFGIGEILAFPCNPNVVGRPL